MRDFGWIVSEFESRARFPEQLYSGSPMKSLSAPKSYKGAVWLSGRVSSIIKDPSVPTNIAISVMGTHSLIHIVIGVPIDIRH